jgi:hypothetical protein
MPGSVAIISSDENPASYPVRFAARENRAPDPVACVRHAPPQSQNALRRDLSLAQNFTNTRAYQNAPLKPNGPPVRGYTSPSISPPELA